MGRLPAEIFTVFAGLWAQSFLLTGVMLDAIHGRWPSYVVGSQHWRDRATKGAIYSAVFVFLIQLLAAAFGDATLRALFAPAPLVMAALAGAALYPLAKTVIESFDGSSPSVSRLLTNASARTGYARDLVIGGGTGLAALLELPLAGSYDRLGCGFALGALAYAGVDVARDTLAILHGPRLRLQTWRLYALGTVLVGVVGGAIARYCDAASLPSSPPSSRPMPPSTMPLPAVPSRATSSTPCSAKGAPRRLSPVS